MYSAVTKGSTFSQVKEFFCAVQQQPLLYTVYRVAKLISVPVKGRLGHFELELVCFAHPLQLHAQHILVDEEAGVSQEDQDGKHEHQHSHPRHVVGCQ